MGLPPPPLRQRAPLRKEHISSILHHSLTPQVSVAEDKLQMSVSGGERWGEPPFFPETSRMEPAPRLRRPLLCVLPLSLFIGKVPRWQVDPETPFQESGCTSQCHLDRRETLHLRPLNLQSFDSDIGEAMKTVLSEAFLKAFGGLLWNRV